MRIFLIITSRFLHENEYLSYSSSLIEEISPSSTVPSRPSVKYGMSVSRVPFFIEVFVTGQARAQTSHPHTMPVFLIMSFSLSESSPFFCVIEDMHRLLSSAASAGHCLRHSPQWVHPPTLPSPLEMPSARSSSSERPHTASPRTMNDEASFVMSIP